MESRPKKTICLKGINGCKDRLSDMPDELIVHILSFMSTLDVAKTMLLRRFGNLWTLVPSLTFDFEEYVRTVKRRDEGVVTFRSFFSNFSRLVLNVLMLHKSSTLDKFQFVIKSVGVDLAYPKVIDDVQMWLRFASDRQVKDISIVSDYCLNEKTLPCCMFKSQSLVKLTLSRCVIADQSRFHMGSVRELSLSFIKGSGQAFSQLISGCPSLQILDVRIVEGLPVSNISSQSVIELYLDIYDIDHSITLCCPNVKILDIGVYGRNKSYVVDAIDVSSAQVVNVKCLPSCSPSPIEAFLWQIRHVEFLTFHPGAFEELCSGNNIEFPQTSWNRLVLWPFWHDKRCVQVILELVTSSVKLEELIMCNYFRYGKHTYGSQEISTTSIYAMPLLKKISFHGFRRLSKGLLQLVEIVLENAVVLEQLTVNLGVYLLDAVDKRNLVDRISGFKRASAKAAVIFD